jgi:transposase
LWTDKNRATYNRDHLRYPSDLTDDEWAHVEPLIPPARRGGGKRRTDMRAVMNGVMYILSTGCQWRSIPKDFRRAARCMTILRDGFATARWIGSIAHCTSAACVPSQ